MPSRFHLIVVMVVLSSCSLRWRQPLANVTEILPPRPHLDWCNTTADVYPGRMNKSSARWVWQPDGCNLPNYSPEEVKSCVGNKSVVGVGDSLIGNVMWSIHHYGGIPTTHDTDWDAITEDLTIPQRMVHKLNHSYSKKRLPSEGRFFSVSNSSPVSSMWWAPTQNPRPVDDMRHHPLFTKHLKEADMVLYGGGIWDLGRASCGVHRYFDSLTANLKQMRSQMKPTSVLHYMTFHWLHLTDKNRHCNHPDRLRSYREAGLLAASCARVSYLTTAPMNRFEASSSADGVHFSQQISTSELDLALGNLCGNVAVTIPDIECTPETITEYKQRWDSRAANREDCCVKNTVCGCPLDVEGVDIY